MAEGKWRNICRVVHRRRVFEPKSVDSHGSLRRCLNCWDLTSLGVGSTLGIGVYVLVGAVALKTAGPSILLSFLIAAVTSLFAGLCYAELGARVPLAGSAFIYTYVTVGELVAFMVGWNNILEFIFGSASVARGLSAYIDTVANHSMSSWFEQTMPVPPEFGISTHFDLFAFIFVLGMGMLLALGVRESSTVNNVFSCINVIVIIFIVIAGAFKVDSSNWAIPAEQVPPGYGSGGFFPYGVWGTLKGAAICFYGFVGFDVVNASGEEVKDPKKTIPIAILSILFIVFTAYAAVSITVTMMVPYYEMTAVASVSAAFSHVGWDWARWIVTVGAVFGISTSLFGALFPLPRLLYSMASDGLFIHWFAKVSATRRSPIIATVIPTAFISLLAAFLDLEQLVLMMCIGTLCSYTIVATCVVLLRYRSNYEPEDTSSYIKLIIGKGHKKATRASSRVINIAMVLYILMCLIIALVVVNAPEPLIPVIVLHVLTILIVIVIALQPSSDEKLSFKTPLVPLIPCLSIYTNIHLMVVINLHTWIRVFIWILMGIPIYFICICCYTQHAGKHPKDSSKPHTNKNGRSPITVQIVVESPSPPRTLTRFTGNIDDDDDNKIDQESENNESPNKVEEITIQEIQVENNEEKEAKIIDLLDQVLQAEEDTYGEGISLKESKESKEDDSVSDKNGIPHRKSLSELSDAGSDASLGNQVLSKYDVIAQVHREDLQILSEEDERLDSNEDIHNIEEDEEITAFNESETNSRTDESGYSDTIDRPVLNQSVEDDTEVSTIPVPPPPPLDENYFTTPNFKKFHTVTSRHTKHEPSESSEDEEGSEPRVSIQSNNSQGDANMRFGSDRQIKFMSKLNDIFQKTIAPTEDEHEPRKRSQSTGNVTDPELSVMRDRPSMFLDLKKELLSGEAVQNLRPVNVDEKSEDRQHESESSDAEEVEDKSMSREDLKHKLENIFALGGPQLMKPRLMKSNPPTPEESYQTDHSSSESIQKLPKVDKNDTLKRQKEKFGSVLNSFRLSMNKDDEV